MPSQTNESFDNCFRQWETTMEHLIGQNNKMIEKELPALIGIRYVLRGSRSLVNKNDYIEAITKHLHERQKNNIIFRYLWKGKFIQELPENVKMDVMQPNNDVEFLKAQFQYELDHREDNNLVDSAILQEVLDDELNTAVNLLDGALKKMEQNICLISCTGFPYTFSYWFGELGVGNMLIRGHTFKTNNRTIKIELDETDPDRMSESMLIQASKISPEELKTLIIVAYLQYTKRPKRDISSIFHNQIRDVVQQYRANSDEWIKSNYNEQYQYKPDDRFESWYNLSSGTGNHFKESNVTLRSSRLFGRNFLIGEQNHKAAKKTLKQKDAARERRGAGNGHAGADRRGKIRQKQKTQDDRVYNHIESSGGWMVKQAQAQENQKMRANLLKQVFKQSEMKSFDQLDDESKEKVMQERESTWKDGAESIAQCTKKMAEIREANVHDVLDQLKKQVTKDYTKKGSKQLKKLEELAIKFEVESQPVCTGVLNQKRLDQLTNAVLEESIFYQKTRENRAVRHDFLAEYNKYLNQYPDFNFVEGEFETWWLWVCREANTEYTIAWYWILENEVEELEAKQSEAPKDKKINFDQELEEKKMALDEYLRQQIQSEHNSFNYVLQLNDLQEQMFVSWCTTPMWPVQDFDAKGKNLYQERNVCIGELYRPFQKAALQPYIPFDVDEDKQFKAFKYVKDFAKMLNISENLLYSRILRMVAERVKMKIPSKYHKLLRWKPKAPGDKLPRFMDTEDEKTGDKIQVKIPQDQYKLINHASYYQRKSDYFFNQMVLSHGHLKQHQATAQIANILDESKALHQIQKEEQERKNMDYLVQQSKSELGEIFKTEINRIWSINIDEEGSSITNDDYEKHFLEVQEFYHKGRGSDEWRAVLEEVERQNPPCLEYISTTEAKMQSLTTVLTEVLTVATSLRPKEDDSSKPKPQLVLQWFENQKNLFQALGGFKRELVNVAWTALESFFNALIEVDKEERNDLTWEDVAIDYEVPTELITPMEQAFKYSISYLREADKPAVKEKLVKDIFTSKTSVSKENSKKLNIFNFAYWIQKGSGEINVNYTNTGQWVVQCPNTKDLFLKNMVNCRYRNLQQIDRVRLSQRSLLSTEEVTKKIDELENVFLESEWNIIFSKIQEEEGKSAAAHTNPFLVVLE